MAMQDRYTLLIVDDERSNLQKLRRTFFRDFRILEALSGSEALDLLRNHRVDVIITDQRMPETTGVDVLRESLDLQPEAIRIILTGYTEVDYLMDAINQGQVHRYITKPWEPFTLKQTVMQDLELLELKRENRVLQEQMRIARQVQSRLFPQVLPDIDTLDYSGICRPAGEVGGDYYDFLRLSEDHYYIAVGDISGKGISAALLMASLQALLRSHVTQGQDDLSGMITEVNRLLCAMTEENRFATLFCSVYEDASRQLTYVNAGHNPPLLFSNGAPGVKAVRRLPANDSILGMFRAATYSCSQLEFSPGDTLLVYTDGITEAQNPQGEQFGEERVKACIQEHLACHPEPLRDRLLEEVKRFTDTAAVTDDQTVVVLRAT